MGIEPVAEVTTTMTSAPQGNDRRILLSICMSGIILDFGCFGRTTMVATLTGCSSIGGSYWAGLSVP